MWVDDSVTAIPILVASRTTVTVVMLYVCWAHSPIASLRTLCMLPLCSTVLAVGFKDGSVGLHHVENGQLLNNYTASAAISSLHWSKLAHEM